MTEEYKSVLKLVISEFKRPAQEAKKVVDDVRESLNQTGKIKPFSGAAAGAKEAANAIRGLKKEVSGAGGITAALGSLAGALGIALSVKALLDFGAACTQVAAEAQAAKAQFNQIFGSLAPEAERSLTSIAETAGTTANSMRSSFNQLAAFAKTTGMNTKDSLDLAERGLIAAADSAAFYDRELSEVTENLRSFLKGNYENDAALGLSATEYTRNVAAMSLYGKSFRDLSEAQKQLTLLKMVEDANKASGALGQAARESKNWTSQTRLLKEQCKEFMSIIGTGLIAVLTPVVEFANNTMRVLITVANTVGTVLSNLFGITFEEMAPVKDITASLTDFTEDLSGAYDDAADAADGHTDAAKRAAAAMRQLMGFDKINKLSAQSSGSSGGGGSGGNANGTGSSPTGDYSSVVPRAADNVLAQTERKLVDWGGGIRDLLSDLWNGFLDLLDRIRGFQLPAIELPDLTISPNWENNAKKVIEKAKNAFDEAVFNTTINYFDIDQQSITVNVQLAQDGWSTVSDYVYKRRGGSGGGGSFEDGYHLPILVELVKNNWNSLVDWVSGKKTAVEAAVSLAQKDWTTVKEWVKGYIGGDISKAVGLARDGWSNVKDWVGKSMGSGVNKAIGLAKDGWSSVGSWVKGKLGSAVSFSIKLAKGWSGSVARALGLTNLWTKFQIKLPKVNVTWSGSPVKLPHFSLKWNARGGILDGATIFGMMGSTLLGGGEAGREAVLPLDSNTGWMDKIADRVAQRVGSSSGSNQPIVVKVELDGRVVAESTIREWRSQARQGRHPLSGLV